MGYYFAFSADIDLKEHYWTPIGTYDNPFNGNFDGKGHCLNGLKVKVIENNVKDAYAGLFGNANVGTIQNVGVCLAKEGVRATNTNLMGGNLYVGGIAGYALNVHNCYVVGESSIEINGGSSGYAGGICGYLGSTSTIQNSLALNGWITRGNSLSNRIVGEKYSNASLTTNYASPRDSGKRQDFPRHR